MKDEEKKKKKKKKKEIYFDVGHQLAKAPMSDVSTPTSESV